MQIGIYMSQKLNKINAIKWGVQWFSLHAVMAPYPQEKVGYLQNYTEIKCIEVYLGIIKNPSCCLNFKTICMSCFLKVSPAQQCALQHTVPTQLSWGRASHCCPHPVLAQLVISCTAFSRFMDTWEPWARMPNSECWPCYLVGAALATKKKKKPALFLNYSTKISAQMAETAAHYILLKIRMNIYGFYLQDMKYCQKVRRFFKDSVLSYTTPNFSFTISLSVSALV